MSEESERALNLSSRELSLIRMQRLQTLKQAFMDKEMEIEKDITMSQTSSIGSGISLGPDSSPVSTANAVVEDVGRHNAGIQGVKRRVDFSDDDDEGPSLSKYSKLTTEQKIINEKIEKLSDTSSCSTSDELSDDSSISDDKNQETDETSPNKNKAPENACLLNEINNINDIKMMNRTVTSNKSEVDETIHEQIEEIELPISTTDEVILPGNSYDIRSTMNGEYQEQVNQQNALTNAQFEATVQYSDQNKEFVIKNSNSIDIATQPTSENTIQENLNQVCNAMPYNLSHAYPAEHSYQAPSTSAGTSEQKVDEVTRANSELNLVQLLLSLKQDVQDLTRKIEKQESILGAVVHANEINLGPLFAQTFPEKYNLKIPFTRIEDFEKFNEDLFRNTKFCNEFIASLCSYIDNNVTLAKNILNMLRAYMSKELAMLFTASKATGNKMVLKDTLFCKCLLQATKLTIRNGLLPLEHEKAFMKNLGLVVSGAKGWHSHDEERRNNSQGSQG